MTIWPKNSFFAKSHSVQDQEESAFTSKVHYSHKGVSTQHTTQQQYTKPRHQQARDRLRNKISKSKAKIKSHAYLQLGEKALQMVHQTFDPNIPVILHLLASIYTTVDTDTIPMLFVIQEGRHRMPTTDCYFTNIQPDPIIISPHRNETATWPYVYQMGPP